MTQESADQVKSAAELLTSVIRWNLDAAALYHESKELSTVAASASPGQRVGVHLLYRDVKIGDEVQHYLEEASPHPFPAFLVAPGTSYSTDFRIVTGTGHNLSRGLPLYSQFEDFGQTGQTSMRQALSDADRGRLLREWHTFKQRREVTISPVPEVSMRAPGIGPIQISRLDGVFERTVSEPDPQLAIRLRQRIADSRAAIRTLENRIDGTEANVRYFSRDSVVRKDLFGLRPFFDQLRARLVQLRQIATAAEQVGGAGPPLRDDFDFLLGLDELAAQAKAQTARFSAAKIQAQAAQRKAEDDALRARLIVERSAWEYFKQTIAIACSNPAAVEAMDARGEIAGVQFPRLDLTLLFVDDATVRTDVVGLFNGEAFRRLSNCQEEIIERVLEANEPVTPTWVAAQARKYRAAHPTLIQRLQARVEDLVEYLRALVATVRSWLRDFAAASTSSGSGSAARGRFGSSGVGTKGPTGTNIDFGRPDFDGGFGSTLGR